jgi:hypothetical protein
VIAVAVGSGINEVSVMKALSKYAVLLASALILRECNALAAEGGLHDATPDETSKYAVSDWGRVENGLQLRVSAPRGIEQGMPLSLAIELRPDMDKLDPRIRQLNMFRRDLNLKLVLTDQQADETWELAPSDPTFGFPTPRMDSGKTAAPLDGTPIEVWEVQFPLLKLYKELPPAHYKCELRFAYPERPTRDWRGNEEDWRAAGFWHGTLASGAFSIDVAPETPKFATFLVPMQLRLRSELVRVREADQRDTAVPALYFDKRDAEEIQVPVHNGHFTGTRIRAEGSETLKSGPLLPNDRNAVKVWHQYKGGDLKASITIEIFETADRAEHMWAPRADVLWTKKYEISLSEREIQKASPPSAAR